MCAIHFGRILVSNFLSKACNVICKYTLQIPTNRSSMNTCLKKKLNEMNRKIVLLIEMCLIQGADDDRKERRKRKKKGSMLRAKAKQCRFS